jgi:hypothetical protein
MTFKKKKAVEKLNKDKSWLFKKMNKNDKPLAKVSKKRI